MRIFDVDEAKRCVSTLDKAFTAIRAWLQRIQESTRQLQTLGEPAEIAAASGDPNNRGEQLRAERARLIGKVQEEVSKLEEFGIEVKSLAGLVDFRALRGGRQVYLCWQFGEPTVMYWHELETGFRGRQLIEDASAFAPSYLS